MKRYIAHITITRDGNSYWSTQMFTAWPSRRQSTAERIAREFDNAYSKARVTSIEEVA